MREIFLNLQRLILCSEGAIAEGRFQSYTQRSALLQRGEQQECLAIEPPVINGVLITMDSQANRGTFRPGEPSSLDMLPFGSGIAHDVAGSGMPMYS